MQSARGGPPPARARVQLVSILSVGGEAGGRRTVRTVQHHRSRGASSRQMCAAADSSSGQADVFREQHQQQQQQRQRLLINYSSGKAGRGLAWCARVGSRRSTQAHNGVGYLRHPQRRPSAEPCARHGSLQCRRPGVPRGSTPQNHIIITAFLVRQLQGRPWVHFR